MSHPFWRRATTSVVGALALTMSVTATASPAVAAPAKPEPLSVFPTDTLTVPDPGQLTGRRVALPAEGCGAPIVCGLVQRLNELDGFDLDPRIAVRFSAPVDPTEVDDRITIQDAHGGWRTGVDRVVYDPATYTVYAHPAERLAPGTTYRLRVQGGPANKAVQETFTTMSATDGLLDLRQQIDSGKAFAATGITPALTVDRAFPASGTTLAFQADAGAVDPAPQAVPQPVTA